jgi:sulfate adenylyltransferase subunit 1
MTVSAIAQAAAIEAKTGTVAAFPAADPARLPRDTRPLRLITCGSVDDGKSTLIGRLL